jgi:hypothetical protein
MPVRYYVVDRLDHRLGVWAPISGGHHRDRTEALGHAQRRAEGKIRGPYRVRDDQTDEVIWEQEAS